ncbi:MAG: dTTP/UTP pyrophosphatase [Syntrophus sp. SKADARSKE-3]|nr:dTTP/UTP pyrophosphatase [Syntrophus sp. SKADARSKE-3]
MGITLSRRLILASASPRRAELLKYAGLEFDIIPGHIDETLDPQESPEEHVWRLSREKADVVGISHPEAWVLGADTIVVIDGDILGKPTDQPEAKRMLNRLSGRVHEVYTGFSLMNSETATLISKTVRSLVSFCPIAADEMAWYTGTPEPYDKAGGYAVQGMGAFFIKEINGSYTNVMGLPLCEVVDTMRQLNILTFS